MIKCPACSSDLPEEHRSCPTCGSSFADASTAPSALLGLLAEEFACGLREGKNPDIEEYAKKHPDVGNQIRELFPTILALEDAARERTSAALAAPAANGLENPLPSQGLNAPVRFVTGMILSARYRIVGLLGKGGMGEVYRAEDLKLAQHVALKFLPEKLAFDGAALARFHREARLARQISHPNVCRVFDIGEEQGLHFLSMEYIDGEDLASLLRRIGRLPKDKAVDVARQLCAGLAAAHGSNVLHRDLKPANIMIDGRGKVKITDFGLAAMADQLGDDIHAGTPAYMAPEQLARKEFTPESDIYALGLVLYEVFTGRKVFCAKDLLELLEMHKRTPPVRPSKLIKEMDLKVEHWIMRCLDENPQSRPSAVEIASVLSGGDALAAALAAGETPSPEMVAASPRERSLRPAAATTCMLAFLICLFLMLQLSGEGLLHRAVPLALSPEVLADRAKTLIMNLRYSEPPIDSTYGFGLNDDYLKFISKNNSAPDRWKLLATGRPAVLYFWYRQSPAYLVSSSQSRITPDDPPLDLPNMVTVFLDTSGNLIEFRAAPSRTGNSRDARTAFDWKLLFGAAGLDMAFFRPIASDWVAPVSSDEYATFEGTYSEQPQSKIILGAAAYHGRLVYFRVSGPWSAAPDKKESVLSGRRAGFQRGAQSRLFFIFSFVVFTMVSLTCTYLARQNLRIGRGDRRGAFRLAFFIWAAQMLAWLFQMHHVRALSELDLFYTAVAWSLFYAGVSWLLYIALEPYIRRRWPYRIISWSRLLAGGLRDPLVGRDVLLGAVFGTGSTLMAAYMYLAIPLLGVPPDKPPAVALNALLGARGVWAQILAMQREVLTDPLYVLVMLLLLTVALRREWLAFGVAWLLLSLVGGRLFGVDLAVNWIVVSITVAIYLLVLARLGLLATIVYQFYSFLLLNCPLTLDFSLWYASGTLVAVAILIGLAAYGYYVTLARHPVIRWRALED